MRRIGSVAVLLKYCCCGCYVALPHGAVVWSAVFDCGIHDHTHLLFMFWVAMALVRLHLCVCSSEPMLLTFVTSAKIVCCHAASR